jgi:hypothetical protein
LLYSAENLSPERVAMTSTEIQRWAHLATEWLASAPVGGLHCSVCYDVLKTIEQFRACGVCWDTQRVCRYLCRTCACPHPVEDPI